MKILQKKEIGINLKTANNYIIIREKFSKEDIGSLMLVTHLRVIAEIENDKMRKFVLKTFKERATKVEANPKSGDNYKTKLSDIVGTVAMVLNDNDVVLCANEIEKIIAINIQKGKEEAKKRNRAKKQLKATDKKALFGNQFKSDFFKDVSALIENEPIDEMGVVALFCMFQSLKVTQFSWKNELLTFVAIKYVRVQFPDASIRCKTFGPKKKNFELDIEFEFDSYNYIRHGHINSTKNCDLIICWTDNAKTDDKLKNNPTVKKMPPVLSLKIALKQAKLNFYPN